MKETWECSVCEETLEEPTNGCEGCGCQFGECCANLDDSDYCCACDPPEEDDDEDDDDV